jgi:hypothetical protein
MKSSAQSAERYRFGDFEVDLHTGDLRKLACAGIGAYLVGEALVRCDNLEAATKALIADWRP